MSDLDPPTSMATQRIFKTLSSPKAGDGSAARLGRLSLPGRRSVDTPNYTGFTSRGVVPHLTPEIVPRHTGLSSAYMALEDFLEKKDPPILKIPITDDEPRRLRAFTAFPRDITAIMGMRRIPAVTPPAGNTSKNISIFTSTGFATTTVAKYASDIEALRPDVVIPPADLLHTSPNPAPKKQLRMAERTEEWVDEFINRLDLQARAGITLFAPIPPVDYPIQWGYLNHLSEDLADDLDGLAIYDANIVPELTKYAPLQSLPKLSLDIPSSPQDILRQVSLGIDMVLVPFVNSVSDSGVALAFTLEPPPSEGARPLGIDLWAPEHARSLTPLMDGCQCHTCQRHHRAYIHHLLSAREMLGWNLLQIHNLHIIDMFFSSIREAVSSQDPSRDLETLARKFTMVYEPELPDGTGERPRARGYHFKSEAGQEKYNKPAWQDNMGKGVDEH